MTIESNGPRRGETLGDWKARRKAELMGNACREGGHDWVRVGILADDGVVDVAGVECRLCGTPQVEVPSPRVETRPKVPVVRWPDDQQTRTAPHGEPLHIDWPDDPSDVA